MSTVSGGKTLRLRVTAAAEARLRGGHPWLFADSIREQTRPGQPGELAVVYDRKDRFLAVGLFDPASPIRVRVLQAGKPEAIDAGWWSRRLESAVSRRAGLFDEETTGFRWVHGESDGWPGLVLDRYSRTLVVKLYTAAWLPRLRETCALFADRFRPERIVLRLSRHAQQDLPATSLVDGSVIFGPPLGRPVNFSESGLEFEADVVQGQKTGFFLDQRENRRRVECLAQGRTVLNAFSFSAGFSLYAARGGAASVTDLDLSAHALAAGSRNFELNKSVSAIASCRRERIQADAFEWLAANTRRRFDLVVLDPPSLAKRESERARAISAYTKLASLGIEHLSPGGVLVACSCSAHVTRDEFFSAVRKAAGQSRRKFQILETTGQPSDHPADFQEAEYLKAIYLRAGGR